MRKGRRSIDGLLNYREIKEFSWNELVKKWHFKCEIKSAGSKFVPICSHWDVFVDHDYPNGIIKCFPSAENSITCTFPHQSFNHPPTDKRPWRKGSPCLDTELASLNRDSLDFEPMIAKDKLRWHIERLQRWLDLASKDNLLPVGDPFELPTLPLESLNKKIVFIEDSKSFDFWYPKLGQTGYCELFPLRSPRTEKEDVKISDPYFVSKFLDSEFKSEYELAWGSKISKLPKKNNIKTVPYILLSELPLLEPFQLPQTWNELHSVLKDFGIQPELYWQSIITDIKEFRSPFILIGFPISEKVGEPVHQIHWLSVAIPRINYDDSLLKGFRNTKFAAEIRFRSDFALIDNSKCEWIKTENWAKHEISSRGKLPVNMNNLTFVMLGGGAFGSKLSDGLIRNGIDNLNIVDLDCFEIGNHTRHLLTLNDVGLFKTDGLNVLLNASSPHAKVNTVRKEFSLGNSILSEDLIKNDVIIDCTANDKVLFELSKVENEKDRHYFSFSLGLDGKRMFCFYSKAKAFPNTNFREKLKDWLFYERETLGVKFPREGTGCWHSVFPARIDDVGIFTSIAVKFIEERLTGPSETIFVVYEQTFEKNVFTGIRRVNEPPKK